MKRFKFRFKTYIYVIIVIAAILAAVMLVLNAIKIFSGTVTDTNDIVSVITTLAISVIILVLLASMAVSSFYEVNDKSFVLRWGVLKNEIPIADITKTIYNTETKKLTVVFGKDDNYMVVSVAKIDPLDIVDALRAKNKNIAFESSSEPENKNKNKRK